MEKQNPTGRGQAIIKGVIAVAIPLLVVLAYRVVKLRASYDAHIHEAQERMTREAELEAIDLLLLEMHNTDCVVNSGQIFPLEIEHCPPRTHEEISQAEAARNDLEADLEQARTGNAALQERLRSMEEHGGKQ